MDLQNLSPGGEDAVFDEVYATTGGFRLVVTKTTSEGGQSRQP